MSDGVHYLGKLPVAPGAKRSVSISLVDYMDPDSVNGTPTWTGATGLTISDEAIEDGVATCMVIAAQDGCDYNLKCTVTLDSTATEIFLLTLQARSAATDPRVTR